LFRGRIKVIQSLSHIRQISRNPSGARSSAGRLFQTRGPWTAKLRSPYFVLVLGTTSCLVCAERRWRRPVYFDLVYRSY